MENYSVPCGPESPSWLRHDRPSFEPAAAKTSPVRGATPLGADGNCPTSGAYSLPAESPLFPLLAHPFVQTSAPIKTLTSPVPPVAGVVGLALEEDAVDVLVVQVRHALDPLAVDLDLVAVRRDGQRLVLVDRAFELQL